MLSKLNTLMTGDSWASPLQKLIREADAILVVLTPDSINSRWVEREIYAATAGEKTAARKRVIPLLVRPVQEIPFFVSLYQALHFIDDYDQGLRELLRVIRFLKHK